jgi:hypothetical protein
MAKFSKFNEDEDYEQCPAHAGSVLSRTETANETATGGKAFHGKGIGESGNFQ